MHNYRPKRSFGALMSTGLEEDRGKKREGSGQGRIQQRRGAGSVQAAHIAKRAKCRYNE